MRWVMSGEWIKMRLDLASDPAVIRIRRALGLDVDAVVGKLHRLWSWADAHTVDGTAEGLDLEWVDETAGAPGFGACMLASGWLEETPNGVRFANFDRHNGQSAKVRALAKTRMKRIRCADSATEAQPEKRREEKRRRKDIPAAPVSTSRPKTAASLSPKVAWSADAGWEGISEADRREWSEAFPGAVIDQELAKATAWLKANPTKAGKRNWRRFVVGWLQRCQDRGGTPSREPSVRPDAKPPATRWIDEYKPAGYRRPKEAAALAESLKIKRED
jgi:hypothetical protein